MAKNPRPPSDPPRRSGPGDLHPAMQQYLDHLHLRGRHRTADSVCWTLQHLHRWTSARLIDALTATADQLAAYQEHLATVYRTRAGKPLARSTLATRIATVVAWYRWCAMRNLIVADPSRDLRVRVTKSRVVLAEHLTMQEVTALIQTQAAVVSKARDGSYAYAIALRNLAAVCIAVATGRRIGGLIGLRETDVDLRRSELRVEREKGMNGRVLPMARWATAVVRSYLWAARPLLAQGGGETFLFLNREGDGPMSQHALGWMLDELVRRTIKENPDLEDLPGKSITWHSLRVSFATMLFANGCDIRSVNELLLHRCLSTTARYTPIPIDDLRQVLRTAHPRP